MERGVEFTAPIAGEVLKRQHDQACNRAKAEKLLARKAVTFQKPTAQKRKAQQDTATGWKKAKTNPPQSNQGGRPFNQPCQNCGGGRGGRGGGGGRGFARGSSQVAPKPGQGRRSQPANQGGKSS